ncbi:MAS protein, partial [Columbina picui]|nr:MAS protein [Columbina picui]
RAGAAGWSQLGGTAYNRTWHYGLLGLAGSYGDDDYNRTDCEDGDLSKVPVTLLISLWGLVVNGAVLWFLCSRDCKNRIITYVRNLAVADLTFLLSTTIALVILYVSETLCHRLEWWDVVTVLNMSVLFSFTASVYLLAAFSATMSLSILPLVCGPCHCSQDLPVLVCALLWVLSFLLTITLYFCFAVFIFFLLSYLVSVLIMIFSGLTLLTKLLCSSCQYPPRKLCVVVLLAVFFFPFLTANFVYWLLLRLFDFSVFVFDTSLLLACVNSSIKPVLYFLAGSCAKKFTLSVSVAFQRAFEDRTEPQNTGKTHKENTVE